MSGMMAIAQPLKQTQLLLILLDYCASFLFNATCLFYYDYMDVIMSCSDVVPSLTNSMQTCQLKAVLQALIKT